MRICHITMASINEIPRIRREANCAVRNGMECFVVLPGESVCVNGITYACVPRPKNRIDRWLRTDRQIFRKALSLNADIYQIHAPELLRYAPAFLRKKKKVIFDSHEFYSLQMLEKPYIPRILRKSLAGCYTWYEAWMCRKIDAVLYVCTVNGQNVFTGRAKHTVALPNYLETAALPLPVACKCFAQKDNSVIYAGSLCEDRGITNLALAAQKAGIKLILCGTFVSDAYGRELLDAFPDTVDYRGVLPMAELAKVYAEAKIGAATLLPVGQYYQIDTFVTKVYEYWWCRLPVILSDFSYANQFIKQHKCGICVDPTDVDAIADAMRYFIAHPDEAQQMGDNGREAMLNEFNWSAEEKKLTELYRYIGGTA